MKKEYFALYHEHSEWFKSLTDAQAGQLIKAIFSYEIDGNVTTTLKPAFLMQTFAFIRRDLDAEKKKKKNICERNNKARQARHKNLDAKKKKDKLEGITELESLFDNKN